MKPVKRIDRLTRQIPLPARVQAFNYPYRWRKLRRLVLAGEPQCRICGRAAQEVHHVHSIRDGGDPYDLDNLMPLCTSCHDDQHGGRRRQG